MSLDDFKEKFPEVPEASWPLLEQWSELLKEWNEKINLVSRKDIEKLNVHHMAHSLAITQHLKLMNGARILDVGTGGGLPGLPMAICYPHAQFTLVDSIGKKIKVVEDIAKRLDLKNVTVRHMRAEELKSEFDFVTGRAVTKLPVFISWIQKKIRNGKKHSLENGLLYWKGGALEPELAAQKVTPSMTIDLHKELADDYFEEKYIVYFRGKDLRRFNAAKAEQSANSRNQQNQNKPSKRGAKKK